MRYWWVSQNKTFHEEFHGGYMWSPQTKINGARENSYENMKELSCGDIVLSYASGKISAIGVVVNEAIESEKPREKKFEETEWNQTGWRVNVAYTELQNKIIPANHIDFLREFLPQKYSPLQESGRGNQAYLFEISEELFLAISTLIGNEFDEDITNKINLATNENIYDVHNVNSQFVIRESLSLVKSRIGQDKFKKNLQKIEKGCRITGISDSKHLIASHIKPWAKSSSDEKIDGNNGLLLSPHIDHLFDKGFITFKNNGDIVKSNILDDSIFSLWGIKNNNVGNFNEKQKKYLEYHRKNIFKG